MVLSLGMSHTAHRLYSSVRLSFVEEAGGLAQVCFWISHCGQPVSHLEPTFVFRNLETLSLMTLSCEWSVMSFSERTVELEISEKNLVIKRTNNWLTPEKDS